LARHEFGMMQHVPQRGVRYDDYEPQKYHCISVEDEDLEVFDRAFCQLDCYWHTTDVPGKGLAWCGITLIPPQALSAFIGIINGAAGLRELSSLAEKACEEKKWIIHYGL